ncbi:hypothetical protein OAD81_02960 [Flavobacteriaceae bacterium]|nr:hypothetical protein [Flavobacteriaceae bacterium]|tara:strand:- start:469 stop:918 length:450 start_codon:yes stop_codon:yes gene_type:complete
MSEVLENKTVANVETSEFLKGLGIEVTTEKRFRMTKPLKDRILDSIDKEIEIIEGRENLTLLKLNKTVNGKLTEVNENRFWKPSNNMKNKLLVNIKLKGKIFGCGKVVNRWNPNYMIVEDDKQKLIDFLKSVKDGLDKVDVNNKEFWMI